MNTRRVRGEMLLGVLTISVSLVFIITIINNSNNYGFNNNKRKKLHFK